MTTKSALITDFFPKRKRIQPTYESLKKIKSLEEEPKKKAKCIQNSFDNGKSGKFLTQNPSSKLAEAEDTLKEKHQIQDKSFLKKNTLENINSTIKSFYKIEKEKHVEKEFKNPDLKLTILPSEKSNNFPLPTKYLILFDIFKQADHIVSIYYNRNETCWFSKLKEGIEQMRKKRFLEDHLGQIKTVYPEAYILSMEKLGLRCRFIDSANSDDYKLTIKPLLSTNQNSINATKNIFNPQILIKRRAIFYHNLLNIVKDYHKKFLIMENIMTQLKDNQIYKWHPKFEFEKLPNIQVSKLPTKNIAEQTDKIFTASDTVKKMNSFMSPRTQRALNMVSKLNSMSPTSPFSMRYNVNKTPNKSSAKSLNSILANLEKTPTNNNINSSNNGNKLSIKKSFNFYANDLGMEIIDRPKNDSQKDANFDYDNYLPKMPESPHLKGLSPSLIQLVRAKEAHKHMMKMTRDDGEENYIKVLAKLPEFLRILKNFFVAENKNALSLQMVNKKIKESYKALIENSGDCDNIRPYLDALRQVAPEWIQILNLRNEIYIKIDRFLDTKSITDKINQILKQKMQ
ncbi:unnamed protein product [Gordionus sp. m RMFG-2023]